MNQALALVLVLTVAHAVHSEATDGATMKRLSPEQAQTIMADSKKMMDFSLNLVNENEAQVKTRIEKHAAAMADKGAWASATAKMRSIALSLSYSAKCSVLRGMINLKGKAQLAEIAAIIKRNQSDAMEKIDEVIKRAKEDQTNLINILASMKKETDRLDAGPAPSPAE
ncbi:hypothetical protein HDE_01818 [Halotydeus destructor]|nr:hypothetical protein HDE_01818 [Halotydeus destructor]